MTNPHDPINHPFEHVAFAATQFLSYPTDLNEIAFEAALIDTARIAKDTAIVEIDVNHAAHTIWLLLDDGQELTVHVDSGHINRA